MKTLVIETSTERGEVAIVEDGHCLYMAGLPFGYQNSRYLLPKIEEGFHALQMKLTDIDLIVAGNGPGSYTGTRVGVVAAKSLAYANKIPLVGVSSLKGFIPGKNSTFAAIFDAKLSGVVFQKGEFVDKNIIYKEGFQVLPFEEAASSLKDIEVLVTPNGKRIEPALIEVYPENKWVWEETAPDPIHMAKLGEEQYQAGNFTKDGSLEIVYLREP